LRRFAAKLVRTKGTPFGGRQKSGFDATSPRFLLFVTAAYVVAVVLLIVGVPGRGSAGHPIPREDLGWAIVVFALIYVGVVGGLYLRDRLRKRIKT